MTILIVEDSEQMRQVIRSFISDLGAEIFECRDGMEAVEMCRLHQPDWVTMDLEMKTMDGISATRQIRNLWKAAKVIIVTNHDSKALRQSTMEVGAYAYLLKDDLLALRGIIQGQRQ